MCSHELLKYSWMFLLSGSASAVVSCHCLHIVFRIVQSSSHVPIFRLLSMLSHGTPAEDTQHQPPQVFSSTLSPQTKT